MSGGARWVPSRSTELVDWSSSADPSGTDGSVYNATTGIVYTAGTVWLKKTWAQLKSKLGLALNASDYGVTFDGVTDDTAAWQRVADAMCAGGSATTANGQIVGIPPGGFATSLINGTITITSSRFWKLYAPGLTLKQAADNTPHFTVTNNAPYIGSSSGWVVEGPTWFTWTNKQATTVSSLGCLTGTGTGTLTVVSSTPFPSGSQTVLIEKERVTGSFSGNTFTVTARGASGTTAIAHSGTPTVYPIGMTNACAIFIQSDATHPFYANFVLEKLAIDNGSYLLGCDTSTGNNNVWGYTLRDIYAHLNVVGGVVSNSGTQGGQPNNRIEGVYYLANSMVGPIFDLQACPSLWMTGIEGNNLWQSPLIIRTGGGGSINIGTLKAELGVYDNRASGAMFQIDNDSFEARFIQLIGMNIDGTGTLQAPAIFARSIGSNSGKHIHIDVLNFEGDFATTTSATDPSGQAINGWTIKNGNYFVTNASQSSTADAGLVVIGYMRGIPARNFYLNDSLNNGGAQDVVYIVDSNRGRVSTDKGDNDYAWDPLGVSPKCLLKLSSGTNPADGDTVVVPAYHNVSRTFRFKTTPAAAGDIKIGADFAATLANLSNAINGTGTPGTDYFTGTFALPFVTGGPQTTANGSNAAAGATLNVADGSALPASGSFLLSGVRVTYTGRTNNQLTGCSANNPGTSGGEDVNGFVSGTGASATLTLIATPGTVGNTYPCTKTGSVLSFRDAGDTTNKTVFSGGADPENVICFETALTANRTVTLPTSFTGAQTNLFNGARVRIVRTGGGAFDLIINRGATEMNRIYSGQSGAIEYVFRRGKWVTSSSSLTAASSMTTPGDPTGTTNTGGKMMGLAGSITPVKTGTVQVTICGDVYNPTAIADGATITVRYGTGSAPTNGGALTGTAVGNPTKYVAPTTATRAPYSITVLITGLTLGTAYWLDAAVAAVTAGTATIENTTITAVEVG